MGVNNIQQVYDKHIEKKYYKIFNDEINKLYSWQSVYRTNQITIGGIKWTPLSRQIMP